MRDSWRHFVAEFIGTFALVFVGGASIMLAKDLAALGLIEIALAHGLILAVMVSALMRISGHFNPAVTLGFLATRRIDPLMAAVYILAQLIGAIVGAYFLKWTFPFTLFEATHGGGQALAIQVSGGQGFALEAVATFFLVLTVFGTIVDPKAPRIGGLGVGFVIAADILAIGPLTGGSMNPARSFGPAVASGTSRHSSSTGRLRLSAELWRRFYTTFCSSARRRAGGSRSASAGCDRQRTSLDMKQSPENPRGPTIPAHATELHRTTETTFFYTTSLLLSVLPLSGCRFPGLTASPAVSNQGFCDGDRLDESFH